MKEVPPCLDQFVHGYFGAAPRGVRRRTSVPSAQGRPRAGASQAPGRFSADVFWANCIQLHPINPINPINPITSNSYS